MTIGAYLTLDEPIELNARRRRVELDVRNTGDRAVQIGSHFHFFEVNRALDFDRPAALGMRLDILSGTTVRIEPGDRRRLTLVEYGGARRIVGFNNLLDGSSRSRWLAATARRRCLDQGFTSTPAIELALSEHTEASHTEPAAPTATPTNEITEPDAS